MESALVELASLSESLRKIDRSRHCSEEQRTMIKKLSGEGKTYKEVQNMSALLLK